MKRYTTRQISALLGEARRRNGECKLTWCAVCCDLSAVVRQMRRDIEASEAVIAILRADRRSQDAVIGRLRRELTAAQAASTWHPIASAPKTGADVLGFDPEFECRVLAWVSGKWVLTADWDQAYNPTHWMPLPPAPEVVK